MFTLFRDRQRVRTGCIKIREQRGARIHRCVQASVPSYPKAGVFILSKFPVVPKKTKR